MSSDEEEAVTALMIGGGAVLLLGIPFWVYGAGTPSHAGARRGALEPSWQPELQVGPTGGSVTWRF